MGKAPPQDDTPVATFLNGGPFLLVDLVNNLGELGDDPAGVHDGAHEALALQSRMNPEAMSNPLRSPACPRVY